MKKLISFLFFILLATTHVFSQDYFLGGCLKDTVGEKMILKEDKPISRGGLPSAASLKRYAPLVQSQGRVSSCSGWATTYAAFTIVKRLETGSSIGPFAPLNVYNKIKTKDNPSEINCHEGSWPKEALNILIKNGAPKFSDYTNTCRLDNSTITYVDRLHDFNDLSLSSSTAVNNIKTAIHDNEPVIIAMTVYDAGNGRSLNNKFISKSGEWTFPDQYKVFMNDVGGHALCIIGYDDNKFGGSFEVMNSWGKYWGKDGFFWIKYSDIKTMYRLYSLVPKAVRKLFTTNHIEFENQTNKDLYIAISYTGYNGETSWGWEKVRKGKTSLVNISNRSKNPIYWFATEQYNTADYTDVNGKKIIINSNSSFENHGNKFSYRSKNKGGIKFTPNEKDNINTIVINKKESKRKGRYHINYGEYMLSTNLIELLNGDINVEYEEMKFDRRKDCFTSSFRVPFRFKYLNYDTDGVTDILRTGVDYKYFLNQKRSKTKFFVGGGEHFGMSIEKDIENDFRKRYFFNETLVSTGFSYQLSSYINLTFDMSSGWGLRNFSNSYIPFNYGLKVGYRY